MVKQSYLRYALFLVLALFIACLTLTETKAISLADSISDKVLFSSMYKDEVIFNEKICGEIECSDYTKNNISYKSISKEDFLSYFGSHIIYNDNETFLISDPSVDNFKIIHFSEPTNMTSSGNVFTFSDYNLAIDYDNYFYEQNRSNIASSQFYFYSSGKNSDGFLVFRSFGRDLNEGRAITSYEFGTSTHGKWTIYTPREEYKHLNPFLSTINIADIGKIHSTFDIYDVNNILIKKSDVYFSYNNNPTDVVLDFPPTEICYTDSNTSNCSNDIVLDDVFGGIDYTSSVIKNLMYTGSSDYLPKSIDFKYSKVPFSNSDKSIDVSFYIDTYGVQTDVLKFNGTLKIGNKSYSCSKSEDSMNTAFTCNIYQNFSSDDSMIFHLDYETFPTNQSYSVYIRNTIRHTQIADSISPPDGPYEDTRTWYEKVLDTLSDLVSGILEGLVSLFVPSEERLTILFDNFKQTTTDKLGFLGQGTEIIIDLVNEIRTSNINKDCLDFPKIQLGEHTLYEGSCVAIIPEGFEFLQDIVKIVIDIVCTIAFLNMCRNKIDEFLGGRDEEL